MARLPHGSSKNVGVGAHSLTHFLTALNAANLGQKDTNESKRFHEVSRDSIRKE